MINIEVQKKKKKKKKKKKSKEFFIISLLEFGLEIYKIYSRKKIKAPSWIYGSIYTE